MLLLGIYKVKDNELIAKNTDRCVIRLSSALVLREEESP